MTSIGTILANYFDKIEVYCADSLDIPMAPMGSAVSGEPLVVFSQGTVTGDCELLIYQRCKYR